MMFELFAMQTNSLFWLDLVFILLDRPDEERDRRISEHIMTTNRGFGSGRIDDNQNKVGQKRERPWDDKNDSIEERSLSQIFKNKIEILRNNRDNLGYTPLIGMIINVP